MRGENGVDECRLSQPGLAYLGVKRGEYQPLYVLYDSWGKKRLTDDDNIELEPAFEQLALNLAGNRVKADVRRRTDLFSS